jgi:hypothetical protein
MDYEKGKYYRLKAAKTSPNKPSSRRFFYALECSLSYARPRSLSRNILESLFDSFQLSPAIKIGTG